MKGFKITAVLVLVLTLVGCASSSRVTELEKRVTQNGISAHAAADQALRKANESSESAANANKCCAANTEKMDRMFKANMNK